MKLLPILAVVLVGLFVLAETKKIMIFMRPTYSDDAEGCKIDDTCKIDEISLKCGFGYGLKDPEKRADYSYKKSFMWFFGQHLDRNKTLAHYQIKEGDVLEFYWKGWDDHENKHTLHLH